MPATTDPYLQQLMRRYGNLPPEISATPLSKVVEKTAPYLRSEAAQKGNVVTSSVATALKAKRAQRDLELQKQIAKEYEDQNRASTYIALANLFGVTPLAMARDWTQGKEETARDARMQSLFDRQAAAMERQEERRALIDENILDYYRRKTSDMNLKDLYGGIY